MTIQNLHNLVHQLTTPEQTLIRYALKGVKEDGENKYRQLFDFVARREKVLSRQSVSMAIYKIPPDTRINKLINRLWEKILDIITSENFIRKNTRLTERSRLRLNARKKIVQCTTLEYLNGSSDTYELLVKQGIQIAEASENYSTLIDFYRLRKNSTLFISDNKQYRYCEKQISWFQNCRMAEEKLWDYYNELIKEDGYGNRLSPAKKIKYLETILEDLKKSKKYIVSVYSNYVYSIIQLDYLFQKENYSAARKLLRVLSDKLGASPLNSERHILARVQIELSNCEMSSGNYQKAVKHAENSVAILSVNKKPNYYYTLEQLFLCVFFFGDLERADRLITELESIQFLTLNDFRISKFLFFRACVHFKKRDFKQALQIANKPIALNKDKTGYDIAIRILRIQCLVELARFDEATIQIENLRKHLSRNYKKAYTRERDKLNIRTLLLMQKRGFSGKPGKEETSLLSKLSLKTGKYKWSPASPELIRFHEWYKECFAAPGKPVL
jgi:hypothetical protein